MDSVTWILESLLVVVGLCIFEVVNSVDNAIINSEVLSTMSTKSRKWFLTWGMIIAVFLVRGLLPILILWSNNPSLALFEIITLNSNPASTGTPEISAPVLLIAGGTFLMFLFFFWLFLEPKYYGLRGEATIQKHGVWFYATVSVLLTILVWFSVRLNPAMAFGAVVGSTGFFIIHGFKENAAQMEKNVLSGSTDLSAISKLLYLEIIDTTFSIDGVLGAFAFTLAVPLIIIGTGIGAIVVRQLTLRSIERVRRYRYLKNGAMYSIFALGLVMILNSFEIHIPAWFSPVITLFIICCFFYKSKRVDTRDSTLS